MSDRYPDADGRPDTARDRQRPETRRERVTDLTAGRRDVLRTIGAGAMLGAVGTAAAQADTADREFVETDGTQFTVGGDPVYFSGSNNFWITDPYAQRSRVDDVLALYDEVGLNLVRTWAFCEGQTGQGSHCLQPEPGVHDEAGLRHMDYLIAKASEHGIRLVLTFVDNWDAYGGIPQYVEWASGASENGDFYVNDRCRELYRNHVETLVTRENSITGVEYRNDPTIAVWELANEPRLEGNDTTTISDRQATLGQWFADMSAFVKDLDGNHLVSTGMEGFYTREDGANWLYDSWTGQDFVEHHQIDTIDVCSFHMYPYHWPGLGLEGQLAEDDVATCVEWIREHVTDAHEQVGKPAMLGEFNVNAQENDLATRNDRLQAWYDALDETDADAASVWQVVLESTEDHDGFQVYRSESGDVLEDYAATVRSKSGQSDGSPRADATGPVSLRVGESGSFSGAYSFDPDGTISAYDWSFDDGGTATGEQVAHRFVESGDHEATLTVTGDGSATDSDSERVSVEGIPADSFLVEGAGEQLHQDTQQFHFAYTARSGDVSATARVANVAPVDPEAQAGLLVTDDPGDPGAIGAATITPGNGSELTRAYDSTVWRERAGDDRSPPVWLRIERAGGSVTASVSEDGGSWTEIGSGDVDLPEDVYVGLFVSSNSAGDLCAAQFDEVTWLDNWQSTDVGQVSVAGAATAGDGESDTGETPALPGEGDEDTTAPPTPANLTVTDESASSLTVAWDAVSDEGGSGLAEYAVALDGTQTQTVPAGTTSATVDGLSTDTSYEVAVAAVDEAGNESAAGTVIGTTAADDGQDDEGEGEDGDGEGGDGGDETPADALVVNDYDGSPAWPDGNDLGNWNGAGSFENGGGSGEVVDGALELEYENAGWFVEQIMADVSEYSELVLEVSGANGGEEREFVVAVGGVRDTLANLADGSIGTSTSEVRIDLADAGVNASSPGEFRMNFWQGARGESTIRIAEVRFE